MAIVKMDKFNLLSFDSDRENLLNSLQSFNYVHFNDLVKENDENYISEVRETERLAHIDESLNKVNYAIDVIRDYTKDLPEELDEKVSDLSLEEVNRRGSNFTFDLIYEKLRDLITKREKLVQSRDGLNQKQSDLSPWQDIDVNMDQLYRSDRFFMETGTISSRFYEDLQKALVERNLDGTLVYKLSERDGNYYVVALSTNKEAENFSEILREFGFSRVKIAADSEVNNYLTDLSGQEDQINKEIQAVDNEIIDFKKYLEDLYIYQAYIINCRKKEASSENFLKTRQMNIVEGYVPSDKSEEFKADLNQILGDKYILDVIPAQKDDPNVPIILKNNKLVEPYENVVETYALPKYSELDPTSIVAPFYTIFTGFMIGDLGYGLLGVIAILLALKLKDFPKDTQKTLKLFLRISISACVFGFIFGSVFGGIIDVPFGWIDTTTDINELIVMSLVIGGVSLFFALGVKGYMAIRDGRFDGVIFDVLSWYMAVGGAIALVLTKNPIAKYIMIAGMIMIVLFAGRAIKSWPGRLASGAYELYGITSWIGDFVSFLRLMALVLSGGFVAYSVNLIVKMMAGSGIGGLIGGIIIFVVFQLFNMFLSYLSAYVHSLRLIYVEMFNKFYEGGGIKFREMTEDTNNINIIRRGEK
ncbi:V-type ATP synthase subunit I [Anaerococcus sp. mt242]|uniref:V-type ATP synthase subunit I n=1 Tax=Anaerococcus sp. mt242 TaxID=2661917 RepID=UPI0019346FD0|nr:V-type ATP synthase subunit I [Anaerococcus sp. mt242]MBM0046248.1 V-type ATP synthase subunit I [Anaerococcus sp. mt242]